MYGEKDHDIELVTETLKNPEQSEIHEKHP